MRVAVVCAALTLGACAHGEESLSKFSAKYSGAEILPVAFVEQQAAADCGAAALTSVGRYWGADIALGSIFAQQAPRNPAFGYSIGELHAVSERLGLASARLLDTPDYILGLVDEGVPVIAPIEKPYERRDIFDFMLASMLSRLIVDAFVGEPAGVNHYVVVLGADEQLVYVLDPQDGYRALARSEFLAQWRELTQEFVPDAGAEVAGFAVYREAPAAPSFDAAAAFAPELAGYDGGGTVWSAHAR
ncbi:MAG: cysteine peptidase family C39 domain-containing protein [Alphaproteobacteria bacterium]|nr:cysteine peptidase family C39 domain-containing protein [Alphaproteobacteria bacterium]